MGVFSVILGNAITIASFTALSWHFNNPWLMLMALLFFQNYKSTNPNKKKEEGEKE